MSWKNNSSYFGDLLLLRVIFRGTWSPVWCILELLFITYFWLFRMKQWSTSFQLKPLKVHLFNKQFTHLIFFWIFCHCLQMSRKKLECFIMMFGQIMNLKHIIFMMDLNAELLLYLQKYKIIPTSLFNVFRRSRGSSLRLASIKSAYLSDNSKNKKNQIHLKLFRWAVI